MSAAISGVPPTDVSAPKRAASLAFLDQQDHGPVA